VTRGKDIKRAVCLKLKVLFVWRGGEKKIEKFHVI